MKTNCNCGKQDCCCQPDSCCCDIKILNAIGNIHNRALDKIAASLDFPKIPRQERYRIIVDFVDPELRKICAIPVKFLSFDEENKITDKVKSRLDKAVDDAVTEGIMNSAIAEAFHFILDKTKSIPDPALLAIEMEGFLAFTEARKDLACSEKSSIIVAATLAKFSSFYWEMQYNPPIPGTTLPWTAILKRDFPTNPEVFRIKWLDIIVGGLNCLACSGGGPAGCIGCGVASGAFGSSCGGDL